MSKLRLFVAGLILLGVAAGAWRWHRRAQDVWVVRPVRITSNWQHRALERLNATATVQSTIDKLELHAIATERVEFDPEARPMGLSQLGTQSAADAAAQAARHRELGRRYRAQSPPDFFHHWR